MDAGNPPVRARLGVSRGLRVALFLLGYLLILFLASIPKGMAPPRVADLTWGIIASAAIIALTTFALRFDAPTTRPAIVRVNAGTLARVSHGLATGISVYAVTLTLISLLAGPLRATTLPSPSVPTLLLTVTGFLALSCMEELGFRGYPLQTLTRSLGTWPAIAIVSLAFGASHLLFGWAWETVVMGVLPSAVLFGVAASVSGGLAMPIGLHAAVNIAQWAVGEKSSPGFWTLAVDPSRVAYASAIAPWIGALVPLLCSVALWRWYPRPAVTKHTHAR